MSNIRITSKVDGTCPECGHNDYISTTYEASPDKTIMQCNNCQSFFVKRLGKSYPLVDNNDPLTGPVIVAYR